MRTSVPALLLKKCAQTINLVVIPALTDASVAEQAKLTAALLDTLAATIEEKGEELIKENQTMKGVIEETKNALERESLSSNTVAVGLMHTLGLALHRTGSQCTSIPEENDRLKGILVQIIRELDALRNDLPAEIFFSLKRSVHSVLSQQVSNAIARVTGTQETLSASTTQAKRA